jgi:hypothetical protein
MSGQARSGEIENPKVGDSVVSRCGMIKVSLAADGSFPVTKLTKSNSTSREMRNLTPLFSGDYFISTRSESQIGQNQNCYKPSLEM